MTIASVCFDLDDTLFDYHRYARAGLTAAADHLADRVGEEYHDELRELYFTDDITEGTFDALIERHDLSSDLVGELVDAFHNATAPLEPYPETESVLSQLADTYRLGLITDGRGGHEKLRRLDLDVYFEAVLVTPTIGHSKRDPVVFERVLSELSVPPEEAVYIGDDPRVDFGIPNTFDMVTIRLRRGRYTDLEPSSRNAKPDYEITQLDDVLRIVETEHSD